MPKIAIATLESPVNLGASDGRNARVVCLVLVPMSSQTLHGNHRHSFEELHRNSALHNDGGDDDNDKDDDTLVRKLFVFIETCALNACAVPRAFCARARKGEE